MCTTEGVSMPTRMKSNEIRKLHQERIKLVTDPDTEESRKKELGSGTCGYCGGILISGRNGWRCKGCGGESGFSYYY